MSAIEILTYLHRAWLRPDDVFVLSKGHGASALYATLHRVGRMSDADLNAKVASAEDKAVPVSAAEADAPAVLGGQRALEERIDLKRWTLWASLVAGVAFLAWMAWRLLKQMDKAAKPGARGPDSRP